MANQSMAPPTRHGSRHAPFQPAIAVAAVILAAGERLAPRRLSRRYPWLPLQRGIVFATAMVTRRLISAIPVHGQEVPA